MKEEGKRKVKLSPWKKMTIRREVVSVFVSVPMGTKRRNQIHS